VRKADKGINIYNRLMSEQKGFKELIAVLQEQTGETLDLPSYLIKPVQQLPRYELLLKEIQALTPPTHKDFICINEALDEIHAVNVRVNLARGEEQSKDKKMELQTSLWGIDLSIIEGRTFLHEGIWFELKHKEFLKNSDEKIQKLSASNSIMAKKKISKAKKYGKENREKVHSKGRQFYIFLFEDSFIKSKEKKNGYEFVTLTLLNRCKFDFYDFDWKDGTGKTARDGKILCVEIKNSVGSQYFVLGENEAESRLWKTHLETVEKESRAAAGDNNVDDSDDPAAKRKKLRQMRMTANGVSEFMKLASQDD